MILAFAGRTIVAASRRKASGVKTLHSLDVCRLKSQMTTCGAKLVRLIYPKLVEIDGIVPFVRRRSAESAKHGAVESLCQSQIAHPQVNVINEASEIDRRHKENVRYTAQAKPKQRPGDRQGQSRRRAMYDAASADANAPFSALSNRGRSQVAGPSSDLKLS